MRPFRLVQVIVSGFRGINRRVELSFEKPLVTLFGGNGTGKTSILTTIEFGLFGQVGYLSGEEFQREDAIVNMHSSEKQARVELTLTDGEKVLRIVRARKMGRRTSGVATELTVEFNGQIFSGEKAQRFLEELLGMSFEDYVRLVMLHQEAVAELVSAKSQVRGEAFDRLLGLKKYTDIVQALPKSKIRSKIKDLEMELNRIGVQEETRLRTVTEQREKKARDLLKKGLAFGDLSPFSAVVEFKQIRNSVYKLADETGLKASEVELPEPNARSLKEKLEEINNVVRQLYDHVNKVFSTERITNELVELQELQNSIQQLKEEIQNAKKNIKEIEGKYGTGGQIEGKIGQIEKEIEELKEKIDENEKLLPKVRELEELREEIVEIDEQILKITNELGTKDDIKSKIEELGERISELENEIERMGVLAKLLSNAVSYIRDTLVNRCPVCGSGINPHEIVSKLEREMQEVGVMKIRKLQHEKKELEAALKRFKENLETLEVLEKKLSERRKREKLLEGETKGLTSLELESKIDELRGKLGKLVSQKDELAKKLRELNELENLIEKREKSLEDLYGKVRDRLAVSADYEQVLVAKIEELKVKSSKIDENRTEYLNRIRDLEGRLNTLEGVIEIVEMDEKIREYRKLMPELQEQKEKLRRKKDKLVSLLKAIEEIEEVVSRVKMEASKDVLEMLQLRINEFYGEICGHPYFDALKIKPVTRRGRTTYEFKAYNTGEKRESYVVTRFSQAQMNEAALATFLALATTQRTNLGFLILDDPSQSMDEKHKQSLAKVMIQLVKQMPQKTIIIATADQQFQSQIEKETSPDIYQKIELHGWSKEGPTIKISL